MNFLIASRPNIGTIRKLEYAIIKRMLIESNTKNLLVIKFSNSCRTTGKQEPNKMDEEVFEDTQLKFMHQVHKKQHEGVDIRVRESGVECILEMISGTLLERYSSVDILLLTQVIVL